MIVVILAAYLVTLGSGVLAQPSGATADRVTVYQRALKQEQAAAVVFKITGEIGEQAARARSAADAYRAQTAMAVVSAERRRLALRDAAAGARGAEAARFDAARAVAGFGDAAVQALAAASAYGKASPANERDRAKRAYAAAAVRAVAFDKARSAVAQAEQESSNFQGQVRGALLAQRDAGGTLARVTAQPAVASLSELARLRAVLDARRPASSALAGALATFDADARTAEARSRTFVAGLAVPSTLEATLEGVGATEKTMVRRADAYFDTELRVTAETEAAAFASALRAATLPKCPPGSACRQGLDREVEAVKDSLVVALRAARAAERLVTAAIFEASRAAVRLDEAAVPAATDEQAARSMASEAEAVATSGSRLSEAANAELDDARQSYVAAIAAADAAYLAAFGTARKSTPPQVASATSTQASSALTAAPTRSSAAIVIVDHVYELVTLKKAASTGYGAYTYVLLPLQLTEDLARESRARYQALLTAIVQSTAEASTVTAARERLNLFCVPSLVSAGPAPGQFPVASYDSSKAKALLATARIGYLQRPDVLKRLGFTAGPFLLTTPTPIEALDSSAPALFVDLSGYEPRLYASILGAYKTTLVQAPPRQDFVQWSPPVHIAIASEMTRISPTVQPIVSIVQSFLSSGGKKAEAATTP